MTYMNYELNNLVNRIMKNLGLKYRSYQKIK